MPIGKDKAPKNLPDHAKSIWASAFNSAYEDTCKGDDECSAKIAWSAVKKKYKKLGDRWVQKSDIVSFDFYITKASQDPDTGDMRWACTASDTSEDLYLDEMSNELFAGFLERIKNNVEVPEPWQSEWWKGGMPYLSISHYPDVNGKAVPGNVESVYMDGRQLKAKGNFHKTRLGLAAYKSVRESFQRIKSKDIGDFKPVRISIGFLDFKHIHKSNQYEFERKSFDDICPMCIKEHYGEVERSGLIYVDGQLIHLALTREPVNPRTEMGLDTEVNKSMPTRKEDAASIVSEEIASEIEDAVLEEMKKPERALVTKSEEEVETEETVEEVIEEEVEEVVEEVIEEIPHVLDEVFEKMKSRFDELPKTVESLPEFQGYLDEIAGVLRSSFDDKGTVEEPDKAGEKAPEIDIDAKINDAVTAAVAPLLEQMKSITEIVRSQAQPKKEEEKIVHRGITSPNVVVNDPKMHKISEPQKPKLSSFSQAINRSVGLESDYVRPGAVTKQTG